jgi:cytidine deaminase
MTDQELVAKAFAMLERSYCPYSGFPVGAALLCEKGEVFTGCNVENASYGATICAEQSAVASALASGEECLKAVAIITSEGKGAYPCGVCRQVLNEFGNMDIITLDKNDQVQIIKSNELLPHAFVLEKEAV